MHEFRIVLRGFVIHEGFEIKRLKNQRIRMIAKCATKGYP